MPIVTESVDRVRPRKSFRNLRGLHAAGLNDFRFSSACVSGTLVIVKIMEIMNTTEDQKKDLAPPILAPMNGPSPRPSPNADPCLASHCANLDPVPKRSARAALSGALKAKIMDPVIMRSKKVTGNAFGKIATEVWRNASMNGANNKKGFRPYMSLSWPNTGLMNSSMAAARDDIVPRTRAVATASPCLIWSTIGARVGITIATAVMNMNSLKTNFAASLSFFSISASASLFVSAILPLRATVPSSTGPAHFEPA
mmetsp:Transcript_77315/g.145811  ORF Transcript_77315/g.145811 Transcript_77315/m.145811 type:complete len:255 (+) Transcript_77315:591-1355(+)